MDKSHEATADKLSFHTFEQQLSKMRPYAVTAIYPTGHHGGSFSVALSALAIITNSTVTLFNRGLNGDGPLIKPPL